jgi:hypothetical protein
MPPAHKIARLLAGFVGDGAEHFHVRRVISAKAPGATVASMPTFPSKERTCSSARS